MSDDPKRKIKNQEGQTLIEFVLLLASITIISFGFMRMINSNIASRWEAMANVILDDKSQKLTIR